MMSAEIALVIPWFGRFPSSMPLWLNSCRYNQEFDFLLFTDDQSPLDFPSNVKPVYMTFPEFRALVQKAFPFPISLERPYKCCDFRPAYGEILSEYLKDYSFWGHCDLDVIFGNLSHYVTDSILSENDRLYSSGHFTLYRNTPEVNAWYKTLDPLGCMNWKTVFTSSENCAFDEYADWHGGGMSEIIKRNGKWFYDSVDFADIHANISSFQVRSQKECNVPELYFCFENGTLTARSYGRVLREEMYVHFSQRKITVPSGIDPDHFFLTAPDLIVSKESEAMKKHLSSLLRYTLDYQGKRVKRKLSKLFHIAEQRS